MGHQAELAATQYRSNQAWALRSPTFAVDLMGIHSVWSNNRALALGGRTHIVAGGRSDWIGALENLVTSAPLSPILDREFISVLAKFKGHDLDSLAWLITSQ